MATSSHGWTRYTGETCDECGAKRIKHIPGGGVKCTNGHRSTNDTCEDCGGEIVSNHLGDFCECEN